jgi:hypothetical protein
MIENQRSSTRVTRVMIFPWNNQWHVQGNAKNFKISVGKRRRRVVISISWDRDFYGYELDRATLQPRGLMVRHMVDNPTTYASGDRTSVMIFPWNNRWDLEGKTFSYYITEGRMITIVGRTNAREIIYRFLL